MLALGREKWIGGDFVFPSHSLDGPAGTVRRRVWRPRGPRAASPRGWDPRELLVRRPGPEPDLETATLSCLGASPAAPQAAGVLPVGRENSPSFALLRVGRFPGLAPLDATSIPAVTTAETVPRGYHMSLGLRAKTSREEDHSAVLVSVHGIGKALCAGHGLAFRLQPQSGFRRVRIIST